MRSIFLGYIFLCLLSCNQFNKTSPNKPDTSWQTSDQPPVFPGCEQHTNVEDQWLCFQKSISKLFFNALKDQPISNTLKVNDTLWLHLRIDHTGTMMLDAINETDTVSTMFQTIQKMVYEFPKFSPPTKTNLGVTTQVRVRLPIQVP